MKYIIIGNGAAGTTAAINIRKIDHEGEITILSDEAYPFYSRIRLMECRGNIDNWKKVKKAMDEKKDISRIKTDLEKWNLEAL